MTTAEYLFWFCLALVAYTYFGYPVVLFATFVLSQAWRDWRYVRERRDRRAPARAPESLPAVSMLIAAYNEEASLPAKLANLRAVDYPREKLEVVFVSDGSTDGTNQILDALPHPNAQKVLLPARSGKSVALNQAVAQARHDILVFSDAATLFEPGAVKQLVRHFADPQVGVVCGALKFQRTTESRQTEGVYWDYESMLRLMEGRLGATLTASGAIYALRRQCYRPLAADTVIEDLVIPMNARRLGYRVLYDPQAVGTDHAAASVTGEFTRRVRLAVGSFRALGELLRIPLDPFTSLALFSHKVLRWMVPFLLIGLFVSSAWLWSHPLYRIAFLGQLGFYLWAGLGFALRHRIHKVRFALLAYFLLAMNLAFLVGFVRFFLGRKEAAWQRVH